MIVTAVLVVVVVIVVVRMTMIMSAVGVLGTMIMVIVVMMTEIMVSMIVARMPVAVCMPAAGIRSPLRVERRLDLDDTGPQTPHHLLDHMIPADAQAAPHDLGGQVTVAEMPGNPHQMLRIVAADFNQRLGSRHDLDKPSVLQHQGITATQRNRFLEIEQEIQTARPGHRHAPPVPVVEIKHNRIGGLFLPVQRRDDLDGADHGRVLTGFRPCRR